MAAKQKETIITFFKWIKSLQALIKNGKSLAEIFDHIIEDTDYFSYLEKQSKLDAESKIETVKEIRSVCLSAKDLDHFLEDIALKSEQDNLESHIDQVTCMTLHHAKGLEFPIVFITGFEDGLFPYYKSQNSEKEKEEERRLAYVGITRAEQDLYLLGTTQRTLFGYAVTPSLSSYISEIPNHLIDCKISPDVISLQHPILSSILAEGIHYQAYRLHGSGSSGGSTGFQTGIEVVHKVWGHGMIVDIDGEGDSAIYAIRFNGTIKKLMAKYAAIEAVKS